jgi:hypothetical protein
VAVAVGRGYYSDMGSFHYLDMDCFGMDLRFGMGCFGRVDSGWDSPIVGFAVIVVVGPIEAPVGHFHFGYHSGFHCQTSRIEGLGWGLGRR